MVYDIKAQVLLLALPVIPALGAILAGVLPATNRQAIRAVGWTFSIITLIVWVILRISLSSQEELLVSVRWPWVQSLGMSLHFGLNEIGIMLAGLVSLVSTAATVATLPSAPELNRTHIVSLLLVQAGLMGVVTSWDLILFIAFWDLTLIAFFFLMGRGPRRSGVAAATRFVITSVSSSVLMWVGVLWLVAVAGEPRSFDLLLLPERIAGLDHIPSGLVWLFAAAFLVRMAALPLHTWFPIAAAEVPTAGGILLAGGVLPLAGFGLVHILVRLFGPDLGGMAQWFHLIGLITAICGGLASIVQRDLKRLFAFVCLAQMGLALAGLTSPSMEARQGGLLMLVACGLGGTSLFLFAGVICQARGSQRLVDISGLWRSQPMFAGLAFAGVASAAAMPGTCGFVAAFLILKASAGDITALSLISVAVLVVSSSITWAYRRVLGGGFQSELWTQERWPRNRQIGILMILMFSILLGGLFPGLVMPRTNKYHLAQQIPPPSQNHNLETIESGQTRARHAGADQKATALTHSQRGDKT